MILTARLLSLRGMSIKVRTVWDVLSPCATVAGRQQWAKAERLTIAVGWKHGCSDNKHFPTGHECSLKCKVSDFQ
jgi:hypothetical protein